MKLRPIGFIIAILLLAMALRLEHINTLPLYTDEGWSIHFIESGTIPTTLYNISIDRHPPLYYLVLTLWQNIAGTSHFALRFISLIGGLFSVVLVYRLAADYFDKHTGLIAALLLSSLDIAIYYSQELRHYGWLASLSLFSMLFFLRYLKNPHWRAWAVYSLVVALLMYTHYFGVFIIFLEVLFGLLFWRTSWRNKVKLCAAWLVAGILYIPWLVVVFQSQWRYITGGVGGFPNSFASTPADLYLMLELLLGGQIALLGGMYLFGLSKIKPLNLNRLFIVAAGSGLFILMFFINLRIGLLSARMISFLSPALMLICALGFRHIAPRATVISLGLFICTSIVTQPVIQPRIRLDLATNYLQAHYRPEDLIISELGWTDFAGDYEIREAIPSARPHILTTIWLWEPAKILESAEARLSDYQTVWLIHWQQAPVVLPRLLDAWQGFILLDSIEFENSDPLPIPDPIRLYRFQRPNLSDEALVFGENLHLEDSIYSPTVRRASTVAIDLWWQSNASLDKDYSVGLFLMDTAGQVLVQSDASLTALPSSQWASAQLEHGQHNLSLPANLAAGVYSLNAVVYHYETPTEPLLVNGSSYAQIGTITIIEE